MNDDVVNKSKLREILKEFIIDILIFPISSNEGDDKKKESKWTGKNSWRLGLLSLGGMVVMFGGSFIYLWGMTL
jgi:hypothetical protein